MAIFGIGAYYDRDVSSDFLKRGCACVGWAEDVAPPAHAILRHLRAGDVIFIKSFTPNDGLTIKAVGLVREGRVHSFGKLGDGVPVHWVWMIAPCTPPLISKPSAAAGLLSTRQFSCSQPCVSEIGWCGSLLNRPRFGQ